MSTGMTSSTETAMRAISGSEAVIDRMPIPAPMSLTQLLSDIGAGIGILSITASLPLIARIAVSVLLVIPVLILVHGKVQDQTLLYWLYLYERQHFIPKHTAWQSLDELAAAHKRKGRVPAVQ